MWHYYKRSTGAGRKSGIVLIVVLGILALLSVLGTIFLTISLLEHSISKSHVDQVHARMLARSGIESAIANLKQVLIESPALGYGDWYYFGEDVNRNGVLDAGEDVNENGKLDIEDCLTERALNPSFAFKEEGISPSSPALVNIKGKPHGYSGLVGGVYQSGGNQYVLKIIDLSSKIYINGGDLSNPDYQYNKVLARILDNLSKTLGLPADTGTRIIAQRSQRGYMCEDEVAIVVGKDQYYKIKKYITVYSWVNQKVVRPVPVESRPTRTNWAKALIGDPIYVMTQINPGDLTFEPRAPINVNTASPEVIQAVLTGLEGLYIDQSQAGTVRLNNQMSNLGHLKLTSPITLEQAAQIAQKIIAFRLTQGPFRTWPEFFSFVDTLTTAISPGLTTQQIDVIKSNANPNNNLNKFNPNALIYRDVDKTDLTVYSTEFCLGSLGYFDIESVGRILNQFNNKVAESKISTRVQLLDFWHETTQEEFKKGTISDAGGVIPASDGKSLQIYPETASVGYNADYDGYILLSSLTAPYKLNEESLYLRASFNGVVDADVAKADKTALTERDGPFIDRLITSGDKVGCVYPDGVYSEAYKCLRFPIKGNINPTCGSIMFWYKPNWDPLISTKKMRNLISMCRRIGSGTADEQTQMFFFIYMPQWVYVDYANMTFIQAYGFYYEGKLWPYPLPYSNCGATPDNLYRPEPHKWHLVSMEWDFQGRGYGNSVRFYMNGARVGNLRYDRPSYHGDNGSPITGLTDLSDTGNPGIRIGELVNRGAAIGYDNIDPWCKGNMTADATIDELCVFGAIKGDEFNLLHYKNGRYYNVGDARFTSATKEFPKNVRLTNISATLFLPKENECRGAAIEFALVGGQGGYISEETTPRIVNGGKIVDKNGGPFFVTEPVAYRVYFKETMEDMEQPILESPVVDDITITYLLDKERYIQWIQE